MKRPLCCYLILLAAFVCQFASKTVLASGQISTNMITEFQHSFEIASPRAKRDLVIAAIDSGMIKRGLALSDARTMFERDLQILGTDSKNAAFNAVVFFERVQPPPNPMLSALRQGWYLDLAFTPDRKLEHYSLSNLHK